MQDDNNEKPSTPDANEIGWLGAAAAAAAVAGLALGVKLLQKSSAGAGILTSQPKGDGWGNWRSTTYAGGFCTSPQCPTTYRDGDEYWCPTCWRMCMNIGFRYR